MSYDRLNWFVVFINPSGYLFQKPSRVSYGIFITIDYLAVYNHLMYFPAVQHQDTIIIELNGIRIATNDFLGRCSFIKICAIKTGWYCIGRTLGLLGTH